MDSPQSGFSPVKQTDGEIIIARGAEASRVSGCLPQKNRSIRPTLKLEDFNVAGLTRRQFAVFIIRAGFRSPLLRSYTMLYCIVLYYIIFYYTILYYIKLYYIIYYYIILYIIL